MIEPIDPGTVIGHVHLKVSDVDRSARFYRDVFGFEVTLRLGDQAVFMSAGGYHHHLALNTWESRGAPPPPPGRTGLFHFAVLYPSRPALAKALRRVVNCGVHIDGAADHLVSESIYFRDPDDNGIEIYRDRDPAEWPRGADGSIRMASLPLDIDGLLGEAEGPPADTESIAASSADVRDP